MTKSKFSEKETAEFDETPLIFANGEIVEYWVSTGVIGHYFEGTAVKIKGLRGGYVHFIDTDGEYDALTIPAFLSTFRKSDEQSDRVWNFNEAQQAAMIIEGVL